jgi:formate dehydrogenase subunit gamma
LIAALKDERAAKTKKQNQEASEMKPAKIKVVVESKADKSPPLPAPMRQAVMQAIDAQREKPGALLPILHGVQDALGYVPPESLALIAHELNVTRAEVHGVVTFYHHFRTSPPGRRIVRICRAEACQALGARALEAHAKRSLGIDFHETTGDGAITLEPVYCLGNCGCGPSVLVESRERAAVSGEANAAVELYARVTPEAFDQLVGDVGSAGT